MWRDGAHRQKIYTLPCLTHGFWPYNYPTLNYLPVSFNQAIGATTPASTVVLSAVMLGHRESKDVYLSLVPVVVGIVIASGAEPMFNLVGFLAALMATAGRALKSVLQGLMLSDSTEKMDSLSLLIYMAPVATAELVPITLYFEPTALANAFVLGQSGGFWTLLCLNAFMAYFVNLTNFLVTKYTSPLTLQVLGNAKGVVAVVASVICFRNPATFYTILGYSITVDGESSCIQTPRDSLERWMHSRNCQQQKYLTLNNPDPVTVRGLYCYGAPVEECSRTF